MRAKSTTPEPVPAKLRPADFPISGSADDLPALSQTTPQDYLPSAARLRLIHFMESNSDWGGVIFLPHEQVTHWLHISAGEVVSFQSFLTARLASALDVAPDTRAEGQALEATMARPERLATHLRSAELAGAPAALLGHLIGAEISAARPYWLGQQVALIAQGALAENYSTPLVAQGVTLEVFAP